MDASRAALLDETMKKSGLVWIALPGRRPAPVWYVWRGDPDPAAYVLTGGGEQPLPGLGGGADEAVAEAIDAAADGAVADAVDAAVGGAVGGATVIARSKDTGALLIGWAADVAVVPPDSPEWAEVLPELQAKRLNPPDGLDAPARWARDSRLLRLTPTGRFTAGPAAPDPQPHQP